ncbi:MAG TPA: DUF2934 domain-containing protein [Ferrovibrio sp.]|jgi:hypothetical protein|uniref:DUF2934 domain-containing protein n=1 Tax=Ferrovibrio sp. TaxID=1917215 RepID=UPI002ED46DD8
MTQRRASKDDTEERIRRYMHQIWLDEGQPEGREEVHRDMARELVAQEDRRQTATEPNPTETDKTWGRTGEPGMEPAEPLLSAENQGDVPTLTDQGEEETHPRRPKTLRRRG